MPYLKTPCGRAVLLLWSPLGLLLLLRGCVHGLRFRPRNLARLMYAASHAARASSAIRKLQARSEDPLVLHAHFLDRPADTVALLRVHGAVRIVTVHAGDAWNHSDAGLRRWRLASFDHFVCASDYVRRGLEPSAVNASSVIHCGVVVPVEDRRLVRSAHTTIRVCTLARLVSTKNHAYAAAVLEELTSLGIELEWHVVGDGPLMPWLRKYAQDSAVRHFRTVVHGSLPNDEALAVLRASDVMILPSKAYAGGSDGIPVALIESMAAGVLAVSTPVGGIAELVIDNVTGIMGDPQNPATCARALKVVLSDQARLQSLLDSAFAHVLASFDASSSAAQLVALTKQLVASRRHTAGVKA